VVLDQRTYINTVVNILKDEGLYRASIPLDVMEEINKRICADFRNNVSLRKCAEAIAHDIFGRVT
jgi:hypothetical protein